MAIVRPVAAVTALATSTPASPKAHEMTPAFVFAGTRDANGSKYGLYRVYVFSDKQCVNTVFRGAIVGGPAYAARNKGTIKLPTEEKEVADAAGQILEIGDEGKSYTAEGILSKAASEAASAAGVAATPVTTPAAPGTGSPVEQASNSTWPQIELLESGWPNGRFFWTVVPVKLVPKFGTDGKIVELHLLRRRGAAGRLRQRTRARLRQGVIARRRRPGHRVRIRSVSHGAPHRVGRQQALLRAPARRVAAGSGCGHLRGRVVANAVSVAHGQAHPGRRWHRGNAAAQARQLVVPDPWHQQRTAGRPPVHELVDSHCR